jgi:D-glycero-D-manno-heptose 1,7-bisphosphate phosphatase
MATGAVPLNRALFLDRDGVVNVEKHYVHTIEDFEFMEGIFPLCERFRDEGFLIVVATNQAGIARGLYTLEDMARLHAWMTERFADRGVRLAGIYHCPHHPQFSGECDCRKPNPGMLLRAARDLDLDLPQCVLLGDKERDLEAGRRAGLTRLGLVFGHTSIESIRFGDGPLLGPEDLPEALA